MTENRALRKLKEHLSSTNEPPSGSIQERVARRSEAIYKAHEEQRQMDAEDNLILIAFFIAMNVFIFGVVWLASLCWS